MTTYYFGGSFQVMWHLSETLLQREIAMTTFSKSVEAIPRSGIREIMDLAWSLGDDITRLMAGEPDFPTPPHIVEAAKTALDNGATRYVANAGLPELRKAVAAHFEKHMRLPTKPSNVLITHGAMGSVATAVAVTCDPGDEILIPDPGWPNYAMAAQLFHAVPVPYPLRIENQFQPQLADLERCVTSKSKCIILCSPSNPTGQVFDERALRDLIEFARRHDLFVISDEIYSDFVFEGEHVSAATLDTDERVIVIHGVSKSYSMTGFRVGFSRGSETYIELAAKLQEPLISSGTASSQYAALAALTGPQDCIAEMREAYRERRNLVLDILERHSMKQYTPRGAFYTLIDVSKSGMNGREFALELLKTHKVAVAPGPTFGPNSDSFIRISLASSKADIQKGLDAIIEKIEET